MGEGEEEGPAPIFAMVSVELQPKTGQRHAAALRLDRCQSHASFCDYFDNEFYNRTESLLVQWGFFAPAATDRFLYFAAPPTEWLRAEALLGLLPPSVGVVRVKGGVDASGDFPTVLQPQHKLTIGHRQARLVNWLTVEARLLEAGFYGRLTLRAHNSESFLAVDAAALRALSVFEGGKAGEGGGVYGYLSRFASTRMGQRVLREWLCQPLRSQAEISFRQDFVRTFIDDHQLRAALRGFLRRLPNLDQLLGRLARVCLARHAGFGLAEVYRLYCVVAALEPLLAELRPDAAVTRIFEELCGDFQDFRVFVESTVDMRRAEELREYFIDPRKSAELARLHGQLEVVREEMQQLRKFLGSELGVDLNLLHTQKSGCTFEAPKRRVDDALRDGRGRFTILTTRKSTVTFTTPELVALNERKAELAAAFAREQKGLVEEAVRATAAQLQKFEAANFIFAEQDALLALAELFQNPRDDNVFCLAEFDFQGGGRRLELEGSWHPGIKGCIANSCLLDEASTFSLITGPNMGGKSTFIRQVALAALLAHVGGPVPARRCALTPVSAILTRVGASDAQLRGVSTFMAEMIDVSHLLSRADSRALVVIDELGRGTSTYEGLGIAQAVAEHLLREISCFCLFATHFHELTHLAAAFPRLRNFSMQTVDLGTSLEFLYRVVAGAASQSFGLNIIGLLGFPAEVVEHSRALLRELEQLGGGANR